MKSITRLSLALMMFSLFSISYFVTSVSADMYNPPPNPSNDPSNTMKSESVDLNKQTLQLHKRITELEQQLNEEGKKFCAIELNPVHIILEPRKQRPFQGWRYLKPEEAPPDAAIVESNYSNATNMPPELMNELKELGLI